MLVTTDGKALVRGSASTGTIQFQQNCYWPTGAAFQVSGYDSLSARRSAAGQEMHAGEAVGMRVDPLLSGPGTGGTIGDTTQLGTLTAYQLQGASPCADAGLDPRALFSVDPGPRDFFGNTIPNGGGHAVGAHDAAQVDTAPPLVETTRVAMVGRAGGAARLRVGGAIVPLDADGNWRHALDLPADGLVPIEAEDVNGNTSRMVVRFSH